MDDIDTLEPGHHEPDPAGWGRYPQVMRTVAETPWAVRPGTLATIVDLLAFRAAGGALDDDQIDARVGAGPSARNGTVAGAVAVLPLYGVLMPRASLFSQMSGGTALQQFAAAIRDAAQSDRIESILLDVDSPGGMVDLVPEAAAEIRAARARKPVVAVANTDAASAAYWLAAQADELVVTPSGSVGSVGVFAAHNDLSRAQDMKGVTTTLISAGKHKVEGNPFEPLGADARAAIQATVDSYYDMFVTDVARGRGSTVAAVRDGYGQGRMVTAKQAVRAGMADRVDTFDATLARMRRGATPDARRAAAAEWVDDEAAVPAVDSENEREIARAIRVINDDAHDHLMKGRRNDG